ncbi:MAG: hypothetical protein U0990_12595 [Candidatus Nanopelagicales bacterium]|nr:hypothetical protein [Candidatus Nanopelagicales bacterium]
MNAIKSTLREGTEAEATVTPIMRERARVQRSVDNQSNRMGALAQNELKVFKLDGAGRITSIPGNPTIQDVAARLPEFDASLTPAQRNALAKLRAELEPYRAALAEQGIDIGSRADVVEGGFYIPRGRADLEGADLPMARGGRGRAGSKKGFERGATFASMSEGIEAGYRYSKPAPAIESYVRDAGTRVLDQNTVNKLLNLTDESGALIAETAADRINPALRGQVETLRGKITGRLQTVVRQSSRAGAQGAAERRLSRLLDDVEKQVTRTQGQIMVISPSERAFQHAETTLKVLDKEANRVAGAAQATAETRMATEIRLAETREAIAGFRDDLNALKGEWERAKTQAGQTPRGQGRIDMAQAQAYTFPEAMAEAINKELRIGQGGDSVMAPIRAVNSILRMMAATADLSGIGIQGLLGLVDKPVAFGRAVKASIRALADQNASGAFIKAFDENAARRGLPNSSDWARSNLRMGGVDTEFTLGRGTGAVGRAIGQAPVIKQANRSFGALGDTLRLGMAQDEFVNRGLKLGDTDAMKEIGTSMNRATGVGKGRFLGDAGDVAEFAPRYFMSQLETIVKGATSRQIEGQIARRQLVKLIGSGVALTVAINEASGSDIDYLTPFNEYGGLNGNFMRFRVGGRDYSVFAGWDSLLRASVAMANGDPGYLLRTKASPLVSKAWDLIPGENFVGEPTIGIGKPITGERAENFARSFAPFSLQDVGQESLLATGVDLTGVKSSPMTEREKRDPVLQEAIDAYYDADSDAFNYIKKLARQTEDTGDDYLLSFDSLEDFRADYRKLLDEEGIPKTQRGAALAKRERELGLTAEREAFEKAAVSTSPDLVDYLENETGNGAPGRLRDYADELRKQREAQPAGAR